MVSVHTKKIIAQKRLLCKNIDHAFLFFLFCFALKGININIPQTEA